MSTQNITQKRLVDTQQLISPLMENYTIETQLEESIVTIPKEDSFTRPRQEIKWVATILDYANLVSDVMSFLKEQIGSVKFETHAFYRTMDVEREPGFIIDLLIVIPDFDRNKKFTMLSVIGDLMRKYTNLLFDFRILKKKEIPEEYSVI